MAETSHDFCARAHAMGGTMTRRTSTLLLILLLLSVIIALPSCQADGGTGPLAPQERLRVATTTSLYDTGLWGYLEPQFEEEYGVELDIIYAGTGKALEYARRGDVDVITIHDPQREQDFIDEGYGLGRHCIAYNYFLIVGPEGDPAGISGLTPEDAFTKLMEEGQANAAEVQFVSRGDNSGTHSKEKAIWASAGYEYEDVRQSGEWYVEAGGGMGPTLNMADQKAAYTLSDIGTFLAFQGAPSLVALVDEGDILLNVYSAIAIDPGMYAGTNVEMACNLVNFLQSEEIQTLIGEYGVNEYGRQLFTPCFGGVCEQWGCPPCEECTPPAE